MPFPITFFVTEESGEQNLLREGQPADRVFFVGHVMIDNLFYQVEQLKTADRAAFPSASAETAPAALRHRDFASSLQCGFSRYAGAADWRASRKSPPIYR
jgi:hypothetical protein